MSIVAITGDHPRHYFLVSQLAEAGILAGWIVQRRKAFVPAPPADCTGRLRELFVLHFDRRAQAEHRFFGEPTDLDAFGVPILQVTAETLNDAATRDFIRARAPRVALSYGCNKLSDETITTSGTTFWNTHGGLSPQYRGVATHFWPSYCLEPQMTGMTLHETTVDLDGGGIIHQTAASMQKGDGLHDLAGRAVKEYATGLPDVFKRVLAMPSLPAGKVQKSHGKLWLDADWRPEHLKLIYDVYEDKIVDLVVDGELKGRTPNLVSIV
jgi:folate-dependent phosphoribosylglycinamide formyltransferase PurN